MKTKKPIYRDGDIVRIVTPVAVDRVGYDYTYKTEFAKNEELHREAIVEFATKMGILENLAAFGKTQPEKDYEDRVVRRFLHAITFFTFWKNRPRHGQRKLYTYPLDPTYVGRTAEVIGKSVAKTGNCYPPSGGYDYFGEYDYDPGGLDKAETHVILSLEMKPQVFGTVSHFQIEAKNVELHTGELNAGDHLRDASSRWSQHQGGLIRVDND